MDKVAQAMRATWETLVCAELLGKPVGVTDGATLDTAEVDKGNEDAVEVAFVEDGTAIPVERRADVVIGGMGSPTVVGELEDGGVIGMGAVTVVSIDGPPILPIFAGVFEEDEDDPPTMEILGVILLS